CLTRQRMLSLRSIGRFHKTKNWSKMNKDELINSLKSDIINSVAEFIHLDEKNEVSDLQLLAYLLANHKTELPFETESYQACFKTNCNIGKMIDKLKRRGMIFELVDLDRNQLPAAIRKNPDDFYPVLVMPIEIKRECQRVINLDGAESAYKSRICI
ncbi:MAG: hypothetical protein GX028_01040, partial [Clostridiaceae bacterium]|nr:hypothetical protein [Clostridiaceae bacterium]